MTPQELAGRWPPVYDAEGLAREIVELVNSASFEAELWSLARADEPPVCQGDVLALESSVPLIDENGQAVADEDVDRWLVVGNTCDFVRSLDELKWTQVVPVVDTGFMDQLSPNDKATLRRYNYYREFWLPPWSSEVFGRVMVADFTRMVTVHKTALLDRGRVVGRMSRRGWALLHACLLRFLCRDDGRHAP